MLLLSARDQAVTWQLSEPANLEKAIKRRAQRCIQNGDLDGALAEYEKLVDQFKAEDYGPWSLMKVKGSSLAPLGTFEKKVPADLVAKAKRQEAPQ